MALDINKLPDRFFEKYVEEPNTGCWLWVAGLTDQGYGSYYKHSKAHKIAYEAIVGEVPEGLALDHLCRMKCCVNPDHLEPVTHKENSRRGIAGEWQKSKINCPQGHEYSGENLKIYRNGRYCRECQRRRSREYMRSQRASGIRR